MTRKIPVQGGTPLLRQQLSSGSLRADAKDSIIYFSSTTVSLTMTTTSIRPSLTSSELVRSIRIRPSTCSGSRKSFRYRRRQLSIRSLSGKEAIDSDWSWCAQLDSNQRPSAPENDAQLLEE